MTKSNSSVDPNAIEPLGKIGIKNKHKTGTGNKHQKATPFKTKRVKGGKMKGGLMRGGLMRGGLMRGGLMRGGLMQGGLMRVKGGRRGKGFLTSLIPMGIDLISNIFK